MELVIKKITWKITKLEFKCESFQSFNLSLWEMCNFYLSELAVNQDHGESLQTPMPLRDDVKTGKGHAVHPACVLIFKYCLKPSCKLTSYTSDSAIQTLSGAQLFSRVQWHYQILLQTNIRSSRNALGAHITKALHWHLKRKRSMLTIQIKQWPKKRNGLQRTDLPDTSKIRLCSKRWRSTAPAGAEWMSFTAQVLTLHTIWPVYCMRPTAVCPLPYDPLSICLAGSAPSASLLREAPDVLHCFFITRVTES